MLVACRLAGLSALETYYAGVGVGAQFVADPLCHCDLSPRHAPQRLALYV